MFFLFLIAVISGLYYYRRFVFVKVLAIALLVCKWRIESRLNSMEKTLDKITQVKSTTINGSEFTEYKVTFNEKEYNVIFFSELDLVYFKKQIEHNINKRNLIVHSSITNDDGEILFDITNHIRRFCFYFDKNVTLKRFFEFLQIEMKTTNTFVRQGIDLSGYNLMLYMNDDNFTEKIYKIKTIYNTDFKSIFYDSEDKPMPIMEDLD